MNNLWKISNNIFLIVLLISIFFCIIKLYYEVLKEQKNTIGKFLALTLTIAVSVVGTIFILSNIENLFYLSSGKFWKWYSLMGFVGCFILFFVLFNNVAFNNDKK